MHKFFLHFYLLKTKQRAWTTAILFAAYILASSPLIPLFSKWLRQHNLLRITLLSLLIIFLIYIFAYFISQLKITSIKAYLGIGFLLVVAALLMLVGDRSTEERLHILEYTFLCLLFFKAAKFSFKGILLFGIPLLIAVSFGWLDELWQGFLPDRVYDIQDVCDNAAGALIGIGFAWIRQKYGKELI